MNILIVDDDPIVVQSCRRILEAPDMAVLSASTVEEGEHLLAENRFDLMLTDIKMPGQDGFEMIRRAKKRWPDMPVLMMTGYLTAGTMEKGRQSGADNCIAKPFTPLELLSAVQNTGLT